MEAPPTHDAAEPPATPRLRDSLAVRITALVLLLLFAAGGSALLLLGQVRGVQRRFDLLTEVYVVFNHRLAAAHLQAMRIGQQVARAQEQAQLAPHAGGLDDAAAGTFQVALEERARLVRAAKEPIERALAAQETTDDEQVRRDLQELAARLSQLEALVSVPDDVEPRKVLQDPRTQARVERLFQALSERSRQAITTLERDVQRAQRRTERLTLALTAVMALLGALAAVGVFLTLRPLRRLTQRVRRLGRGDLAQRVDLSFSRRNDEVTTLAREFNHMAEALEERERRLLQGERLAAAGQLAAQITHEIRNPLSSVALNVELLEDELEGAAPEARGLVRKITAEVDRLAAVTDDYLSFARRPKPQLQPVELGRELRDLLEFFGGELDMAGVEVSLQVPDGPLWVRGDPGQLRQVLLNLLRNSQEAVLSPQMGERAPRVWVRARLVAGEVGAGVEVEVEDNGPGIEGDAGRIFEAFVTSKARGTGLGLPIVQQIVSDHGGVVEVVRTGPSGTCFRLCLPACDPPAAPVTSPPA